MIVMAGSAMVAAMVAMAGAAVVATVEMWGA